MADAIETDAVHIRKLIREAEGISDELLVVCAKLKQAMILARQNPSITLAAGQKALLRLVDAEGQAIKVSSSLFRVHEELNSVGRVEAGLDEDNLTPISGTATLQERDLEVA